MGGVHKKGGGGGDLHRGDLSCGQNDTALAILTAAIVLVSVFGCNKVYHSLHDQDNCVTCVRSKIRHEERMKPLKKKLEELRVRNNEDKV